MNFIWYDLILLVSFVTCVSLFLYFKKKNLKKEGFLILYKTPWGIKLINRVGRKYKKTMKALSWMSIVSGYILMAGMFYLFYKILKIYIFNQEIVRTIKVPPIMPLIPYIDKIVPGLPSFYFFYWILIIMIIAIPHEFAHGIMAAYNKVKIKTTGFGFFPSFLPVFLAAFVELDEKKMSKKNKFKQMAVLSSGTFANVITALILLGLLWLIFPLLFVPSGLMFGGYQMSIINSTDIQKIDGEQISFLDYEILLEKTREKEMIEITSLNKTYFIDKGLASNEDYETYLNQGYAVVYENSPAIRSRLRGKIIEIEGMKIKSLESFQNELAKYSPGDKITISTTYNGSREEYDLILEENQIDNTKPLIGITLLNIQQKPLTKFLAKIMGFRDAHTEYVPRVGELSMFFYNLLWWAILISFSVALINMLPVGIFDGGRFFYLTILALTKSEEKARKSFSFLTYFFLFLILLLMVFWASSFF